MDLDAINSVGGIETAGYKAALVWIPSGIIPLSIIADREKGNIWSFTLNYVSKQCTEKV